MKNILTISQNELETALPKVQTSALRTLLRGIYEIKSPKLSVEQTLDIERKETKIWAELQRRGLINKNTNVDFTNWLYRQYPKRMF